MCDFKSTKLATKTSCIYCDDKKNSIFVKTHCIDTISCVPLQSKAPGQHASQRETNCRLQSNPGGKTDNSTS